METILIVDDDQVYLDLLRLNLEGCGYRALTAGSTAEAWTKLEQEAVDLAILDVDLPSEDGPTFMRRVRASSRLAGIPVLFLSGMPGAEPRASAIESGGDDFVQKPVSPIDLVVRVRAHLKRRAWQRRLDDGLARLQDVVRSRDELLALVVHEVGGLLAAVEAELAGGDAERALGYVRELKGLIQEARARHDWRETPAPATTVIDAPA